MGTESKDQKFSQENLKDLAAKKEREWRQLQDLQCVLFT